MEFTLKKLAKYIDVFCEKGYFSLSETKQILEAGVENGFIPKVHVNQFTSIGGIQKAIEWDAISVDHLEVMEEEDYLAFKNSSCIATLLPSCSFFLGIPYSPAKEFIKKCT